MYTMAVKTLTAMANSSPPDAGSVLTLSRGLAILDAFVGRTEALGVNEIARFVGVHKSTVSRLCATLAQGGYLERTTASGKFRLGPRLFQLVGAPSAPPDLRAAARPILQALVDKAGETAHLGALQASELITIEVIEGRHLMRMQGRVGQRQLFHASALGLAILAQLPRTAVDDLLGKAPLTRLTPHTVVDRRQLRQRLAEIRTTGYSVDFEGVEEGLRCVGAVVLDQHGGVAGAISVSGPRHRLSPEVIAELGALVRSAATAISARIGAPQSALTLTRPQA
jgi:DNA-binding IclR family transcriptional regulator